MQKTNLHLHSKFQQNILIVKKIKPFTKSKMAALKIQNQQFWPIIQLANCFWKPIIRPGNYCRSIKGPVVFDLYKVDKLSNKGRFYVNAICYCFKKWSGPF